MREYLSVDIEGASYGEVNLSSGKGQRYTIDKKVASVIKFFTDEYFYMTIRDKDTMELHIVTERAFSITQLGSNLVVVSEDTKWYS